jgi:pyrroloquinoline quinone biosynthesis protein B
MVHEGFIAFEALLWDEPYDVVPGVTATPLSVPHRSEWPTDTAALLLRGPAASLLYLPDIDFWEQWARDIEGQVESVDVALLDGTFWTSPTSADVPHPPILRTMERLESIAAGGTTRIVFTHLNHSNPALIEGSPEEREVVERGFEIAREGLAFEI